MRFFDVAKDLCNTYPDAGLLAAIPSEGGDEAPYLQVMVLSRETGEPASLAVIESERSLESGPQARWYWYSLLGLPMDLFVPEDRLADAYGMAQGARTAVRHIVPYTAQPFALGSHYEAAAGPARLAVLAVGQR